MSAEPSQVDEQLSSPTPVSQEKKEVKESQPDNREDINTQDERGWTALHHAVFNEDINLIKSLIVDKHADIHAQDKEGNTPLHRAVLDKKIRAISCLLKLGADIDRTTPRDYTPLHWAAYLGLANIVGFLLMQGANPRVMGGESKDQTPLMLTKDESTVKLLLDLPAIANCAARNGKLLLLQEFISERKNLVNTIYTQNNQTLLHLAACNGHVEVVTYLLEQGANITAKDKNGHTPLHLAACKGHVNVVSYLLEQGANIKAKDKNEDTPLHLASSHGHATVVEFMLEKSAKIIMNKKNEKRETPLHQAVCEKHIAAVKLLLRYGANPDPRDGNSLKPIDWARAEKSKLLKRIQRVEEQQASLKMINLVLEKEPNRLQREKKLSQMQQAYSNYAEIVESIVDAQREAAEKQSVPSAPLSGNFMGYFGRREDKSPTTMRMLALLQAAALFGVTAIVVILAIWLAQTTGQEENNNELKRPSFQK